jgi:hypothetical protein
MRSGRIYEQATWAHRIKENEYGLLPTPQASDGQQGSIMNDNTKIIFLKSGKPRKISNQGISGSLGLARYAQLMWPTPTVNDAKNCTLPKSQINRDSIAGKLLRTPDANMGKRGCKSREGYEDSKKNGTHAINLNDQAQHEYGMKRLNPELPEWMMGYPEKWTVIDCEDSGMRLSLK